MGMLATTGHDAPVGRKDPARPLLPPAACSSLRAKRTLAHRAFAERDGPTVPRLLGSL